MAKVAAEYPRQLEVAKRDHPEIRWIAVASPVWTTVGDLPEYQTRLGATGPIGIDEDSRWFRHFAVRAVPTTIFLTAEGTEIARESDPAALADRVREIASHLGS